MKKSLRFASAALALTLAAGCAMPAFAAGKSSFSKSETVYAVMNGDGSIKSTTVSEHLYSASGLANVTDKTTLTDIQNTESDAEFTQNGEELVWNTNDTDVYYKGNTDKALPIDVKVTYALDGQEAALEDIIGKSGHLTVTVNLKNNETGTVNVNGKDRTIVTPLITAVIDNSQVIVVADDSGIEKLTDLAGKTVGVQAASAALDLLQSEEEGGQKELADTFGALNEFADYNTAFTELQAGALDALAIDVGVAKYQLNSRGEGFKILDETLNTEQYAIGFEKGNTELCDIVNADLQKLADDGTVAELAEKYEIADMVTLKASDDASTEDSKDATDDAETDKTEEK